MKIVQLQALIFSISAVYGKRGLAGFQSYQPGLNGQSNLGYQGLKNRALSYFGYQGGQAGLNSQNGVLGLVQNGRPGVAAQGSSNIFGKNSWSIPGLQPQTVNSRQASVQSQSSNFAFPSDPSQASGSVVQSQGPQNTPRVPSGQWTNLLNSQGQGKNFNLQRLWSLQQQIQQQEIILQKQREELRKLGILRQGGYDKIGDGGDKSGEGGDKNNDDGDKDSDAGKDNGFRSFLGHVYSLGKGGDDDGGKKGDDDGLGLDDLTDSKKDTFQNETIQDLGYFYNGPPWFDPKIRPISPSPSSDVVAKFWLFTEASGPNGNGTLIDYNRTETLTESTLVESTETVFIIHDYITDSPKEKFYEIRANFYSIYLMNTFIVDWTEFNKPPYPQAVANARVVGAQIARMIEFLEKEKGMDRGKFRLIGHGVGAHIAGYAGKRLNDLVRISALDPADPYFGSGPDEIRLSIQDAKLVDVIHTNIGNDIAKGLGISEAFGHLDFYPNGGDHQPGCTVPSLDDIDKGSAEDDLTSLMGTSCDHNRAVDLFAASISRNTDSCPLKGIQCENHEDFQKEKCKDNLKIKMGYKTIEDKENQEKEGTEFPEKKKWYLTTTEKKPFCTEVKKEN